MILGRVFLHVSVRCRWDQQTSRKFTALLFVLYALQVTICGLYVHDGAAVLDPEVSSGHEVDKVRGSRDQQTSEGSNGWEDF